MIIAFSGLDGSGKSTHAKHTFEFLKKKGYNVKMNHIVNLSLFNIFLRTVKEGSLKYESKKEAGEGREYLKPYHVIGRMILFFIDLIVYHAYTLRYRFSKKKIIVFDRYLYDKLANFNHKKWAIKFYSSIFLFFAPRSDIVFFIDRSAEDSYKKKPEYSKEFTEQKYDSYNWLMGKGRKNSFSIRFGSIEEVQERINGLLSRIL